METVSGLVVGSHDQSARAAVDHQKIATITHGNTAVAALRGTSVHFKITHLGSPKQEGSGSEVDELAAVELLGQ